jgi:DNA replication and repair protein RecF
MILAWKTAELALLEHHLGDPPIFLLDDVSSELDPLRNQHLFAFLREQRNQCFITTTHPQHVLLEQPRIDYAVEGGCVTRKN